MSLISEPINRWTNEADVPIRCGACKGLLRDDLESLSCENCGVSYPIRDGILIAKDEPAPDNLIARDYYNGALWPKFRLWERLFWLSLWGERKARQVILKELPDAPNVKLLDIAIGDGVYTGWLPQSWSITGLDVSTSQLKSCRTRNAGRDLRLILGEAESLPFDDDSFDAVLSIGGFNHFNDSELALREMARVAKPGSRIVVSDELPDITGYLPGHLVGLPKLDNWFISKVMNLGDPFTDLVERHRDIDIPALGRSILRDSRYKVIWRGGGYLMTGLAP